VRAWVGLHVHNDRSDQIQSGTETGIDCGGSCAIRYPRSTLASQWSANYTNDSSIYTATNLDWNGNIPPTQTINFGFCANKTGPNWRPEFVSATVE